jgi:DNA-binding protein H-NS
MLKTGTVGAAQKIGRIHRLVRSEPVKMKLRNLDAMSIDELWTLREEVAGILATKISGEKAELEERLRRLGRHFEGRVSDVSHSPGSQRERRRPYPRVAPKYCNPSKPSETWSGRGKTPRWLRAQLDIGRNVEDFRISSS